MKRYFAGIIIIAVVSVVGVYVQNAISMPNSTGEKTGTFSKMKMIETARPQRYDFSEVCPFFGKVESKKKVTIISLVKGRVVSVDAEDEKMVRKEDLLFTIGGPQIDIHLEALKRKVGLLKKQVFLAKKNSEYQKQALSEKFVKKEDLNRSLSELARAQTEFKEAQQALQSFKNALYIRATIDGIFTARKVNTGQEIEKGDQLAQVIEPENLRIVASLFPRTDSGFKEKKIIIKMQSGDEITANVVNVLARRTHEGATVIWIEGPELNRRLFPGETVSGKLTLSAHRKKLSVSQSAIVKDEKEHPYVFLKVADGYRKQPVVTGLISRGRVEIVSGVKETDEVVVKGAYELFYRDFNKTYKVSD